nr:hypothetical protein [Saccharothrix sp. ST-888]
MAFARARIGPSEGTADAGSAAREVEVFPTQPQEFALAETSAQGEFEQCLKPVAVGSGEELTCLVGGEWLEAAGSGCAHADVAGDVARDLLLADGVLQRGLEHGVDVGKGQRGEPLAAALPDRAAARPTGCLRCVGVAAGVEAACAALAAGAELVEPGADVLGGEFGELLPPEAGYEVEPDAGGVAGVGVLAEAVDGDGLKPVRQVYAEAALGGRGGDAAVAGGDLLGELARSAIPRTARGHTFAVLARLRTSSNPDVGPLVNTSAP